MAHRKNARVTLWYMLFLGILCNMMCYLSLNMAIIYMVRMPENQNDNSTSEISSENEGPFNWTNDQKHTVLGSFHWFHGTFQIVSGLSCHKYGAKAVFFASNFLMGICSFFIPTAAKLHYVALVIMRIIQGMGEGLAASAPAFLVSQWVAPDDRAKYMAVTMGYSLASVIWQPIFGFVVQYLNWKWNFYLSACIALLWCVLWWLLVYDKPQKHPKIDAQELSIVKKEIGDTLTDDTELPIPWLKILLFFPYWVNTASYFGVMFSMLTFTIYMPTYLKEIHGFSISVAGTISGTSFIFMVLFSFIFCTFADSILTRQKLTRTNVRKFAVFVASICGGFLTIAMGYCGYHGMTTAFIILYAMTVLLHGAMPAGVCATVLDISPNFCGILQGIQGFVIATPGIFAPMVVSHFSSVYVDDLAYAWANVFVVTGLVNLIPALLFLAFGSAEVQKWNFPVEQGDRNGKMEIMPLEARDI